MENILEEEVCAMVLWKPDPTFYPSPKLAMQAPPERLAYVATVSALGDGRPDAMAVVDVDPRSPTYSQMVGQVDMPYPGDELHHFGWNACSAALCPYAPHPHIERRYLVVPGIRSSRIYILDTKPDPAQPRIVKVIEPEEVIARSGYTRPHTVHCGPDGRTRRAARRPPEERLWTPTASLGPASPSTPPGLRFGCGAADGARAAP